jgi:26S proteasome regulatory subunit, ATPase 3, interacting protein
VDVCANLKGAVPKASTQKILMALAEKGEVTQKVYGKCHFNSRRERGYMRLETRFFRQRYNAHSSFEGKSTFFVAKQETAEAVPAEKLDTLEEKHKEVEEETKGLGAEIKTASAGRTRPLAPR